MRGAPRRRVAFRAAAAISILGAAAAGCAPVVMPAVDEPVLASAESAGWTADQVARGRELMVGTCTACHQPVHPDELALDDWLEIIPRMVRKSNLPDEACADLRAYVEAVRAVAAAPAI